MSFPVFSVFFLYHTTDLITKPKIFMFLIRLRGITHNFSSQIFFNIYNHFDIINDIHLFIIISLFPFLLSPFDSEQTRSPVLIPHQAECRRLRAAVTCLIRRCAHAHETGHSERARFGGARYGRPQSARPHACAQAYAGYRSVQVGAWWWGGFVIIFECLCVGIYIYMPENVIKKLDISTRSRFSMCILANLKSILHTCKEMEKVCADSNNIFHRHGPFRHHDLNIFECIGP